MAAGPEMNTTEALEHERRHAAIEARVSALELHPIMEPRTVKLEARVLMLERVGLAVLTTCAGMAARLLFMKLEAVLSYLAAAPPPP